MKTYIKTSKHVFTYPNVDAAERALPRIRRSDRQARILRNTEEYPVLRSTPSDKLILA